MLDGMLAVHEIEILRRSAAMASLSPPDVADLLGNAARFARERRQIAEVLETLPCYRRRAPGGAQPVALDRRVEVITSVGHRPPPMAIGTWFGEGRRSLAGGTWVSGRRQRDDVE